MRTPDIAISIRQPWAWAILNAGKDVENRAWLTRYRGPVLIHAGKAFRLDTVRKEFALFMAKIGRFDPWDSCAKMLQEMHTQTGGIVGLVTITDCIRNSPSPWAIPGEWHWLLADARPLPFMRWRGQRGLFQVNYENREADHVA